MKNETITKDFFLSLWLSGSYRKTRFILNESILVFYGVVVFRLSSWHRMRQSVIRAFLGLPSTFIGAFDIFSCCNQPRDQFSFTALP